MEPRVKGTSSLCGTKTLQTHNRGTFCGLKASKRETLPATKPKSLNNRENDEKNLSRSLAGVEPALLSPGGKLCNPIGFGDTARLTPWKNLPCWVQRPHSG